MKKLLPLLLSGLLVLNLSMLLFSCKKESLYFNVPENIWQKSNEESAVEHATNPFHRPDKSKYNFEEAWNILKSSELCSTNEIILKQTAIDEDSIFDIYQSGVEHELDKVGFGNLIDTLLSQSLLSSIYKTKIKSILISEYLNKNIFIDQRSRGEFYIKLHDNDRAHAMKFNLQIAFTMDCHKFCMGTSSQFEDTENLQHIVSSNGKVMIGNLAFKGQLTEYLFSDEEINQSGYTKLDFSSKAAGGSASYYIESNGELQTLQTPYYPQPGPFKFVFKHNAEGSVISQTLIYNNPPRHLKAIWGLP